MKLPAKIRSQFSSLDDRKKVIAIAVTLLLLVGLPVAVYISSKSSNLVSRAAGITEIEVESGTKAGTVTEVTDANASGGKYLVFGTAPVAQTGAVPIPKTGAYWGFTHAAAMADPYPLSSCSSGTNHAKLECKIQWAAGQQGLSAPLQSDGKYHTAFEHMFTSCTDADSKFQPGGSVWNSASVPGRKLMLINMKCGGQWATIANGGGTTSSDTSLKRKIQLLSQMPVPVVLTWHHEPENDSCGQTNPTGTPDEFRKAYRQFAAHVRANGAGKVATGWILMGWTFDLDNNTVFTNCDGVTANNGPLRNPENWWPGDDAVDWIMSDPYAETATFSTLVQKFYNWSNAACPTTGHPTTDWNCTPARASKPLGLAEYSYTGAQTEANREAWINDHKVKMRNYPDIKLYAWWSDQVNTAGSTPWWADYPTTDANRTVLKAYTRLSLDPWVDAPTF